MMKKRQSFQIKCPKSLILQKRFHGIGDISLIFQYFLNLFFALHSTHSSASLIVRFFHFPLLVLTEIKKEKIFPVKTAFFHPNIRLLCLKKSFYTLGVFFKMSCPFCCGSDGIFKFFLSCLWPVLRRQT